MVLLEHIQTNDIYQGDDIQYIVDDTIMLGEVYLDGNLIFQIDDVMTEKELEHIFKKQYKISYPERPSLIEDIFAGDDSFDY